MANEDFIINAVGLPDAGIEKAKGEFEEYLKRDNGVPLIINIVGGKADDFVAVAEAVNDLKPQIIELNIVSNGRDFVYHIGCEIEPCP